MCFMGAFKYLFKKRALPRKKIWSAGFGISKIKSAGFGYRKMHVGMQASAPFFGSLQALDSKNQRKKVVCRLRHPPLEYPHSKWVKNERFGDSSKIQEKNCVIWTKGNRDFNYGEIWRRWPFCLAAGHTKPWPV